MDTSSERIPHPGSAAPGGFDDHGVILASGSPRRAAILRAAGVEPQVIVPAIDDADAPADRMEPARMVMALAWFKARQALREADRRHGAGGPRWLVAADTMCVDGARVIGKPAGAEDARSMVAGFRGRSHQVVTGVCVVDRTSGTRVIRADSAVVSLGPLDDAELERYVQGGDWHGKAGGYNYADRVAAGWPLACTGDPETVMGLPSRIVLPLIGRDAVGRDAVGRDVVEQGRSA